MTAKITNFLSIYLPVVFFAEAVILSKEKNQSLTKWAEVIDCVIETEMTP